MRQFRTWGKVNSVMRVLLTAALLLTPVAAFAAEKINLDFGFAIKPTDAYGAGSEQTGSWNAISTFDPDIPLVDTTGAATSATVTVTGSQLVGYGWGYSDDPQRLFDFLYEDSGQWSVTISGLENGEYDVFYYAAPTPPTGDITINGIARPSLPGNSTPPSTQIDLDTSFQVVRGVGVANNQIEILDVSAEEFSAISAVQIMPRRRNDPNPFLLVADGQSEIITEIDSSGKKVSGPVVTDGGLNVWFATGGNVNPEFLIRHPSGDILSTYYLTNEIRRFSSTGEDLGTFTATNVSRPVGLAFDSACNLYVGNLDVGTVTRYDSSGAYIDTFLTGLTFPTGMDIDSRGNLYVAQRYGPVFKFDPAGNQIKQIDGFTEVWGLTVDSLDKLYVADYPSSEIRRFYSQGQFQRVFGTGTAFSLKFGPDGELYAANGSGVHRWEPDGTFTSNFAAVPGILVSGLVVAPGAKPVRPTGLPDFNSNGVEDLAVLRPGSIMLEVRDGLTRQLQRVMEYFDDSYSAKSTGSLPDLDGNGFAELAVMAAQDCVDRAVVEVRNLAGDETPRRIWFAPNHTPIAMVVVDDADNNGIPELAVLSVRNSDGRIAVEIKNAYGPTNPRMLWFMPGNVPVDLEVVPDKDANGIPEIAVLSTRSSDGRIVVEIKNAAGATNPSAVWFMPGNIPIDLASVADRDSNGVPEVAVLSSRVSDGRNVVEIKNAAGATNPNAVWFAAGYTATEVLEVNDADSNGVTEVAVLSTRDSDGRILVEVKNVTGATNQNSLWYTLGHTAHGMFVVNDADSNGVEELGVLLIRDFDDRIRVQSRNASGDPAPIDYWFSP